MGMAVAKARKVMDKPIALLLQGESGVGKDMFAQAMHQCGHRRDRPFVAVNCAALPDTMIEAELFGYESGAFTGAKRGGSVGRIREAHGGTLFLDEIGDMPLALQARLLRVLQDRQVVPLGGGKPCSVDFALITATHQSLKDAVALGRFRADLYYRLNGLTITLPALRQRNDLAGLVDHCLTALSPQRPVRLASTVMTAFSDYDWPGNIRQLVNALQTGIALLDADESEITWLHLPDDLAEDLRDDRRSSQIMSEASQELRSLSLHAMQQAVDQCHGNVSEAARRLGISRNTLYRKLDLVRR